MKGESLERAREIDSLCDQYEEIGGSLLEPLPQVDPRLMPSIPPENVRSTTSVQASSRVSRLRPEKTRIR